MGTLILLERNYALRTDRSCAVTWRLGQGPEIVALSISGVTTLSEIAHRIRR